MGGRNWVSCLDLSFCELFSGDQAIEAPSIILLGGQEEACCADGENGVVDGGDDAVGDGHGDGKAKGEAAGSRRGPSGEEPEDQEGSGGDFDDGGDHGECFGEAIGQEVHELMGVGGEVFPVAPADPGSSVGSPGSEAVETEDKKTCSQGDAEVELGEGS